MLNMANYKNPKELARTFDADFERGWGAAPEPTTPPTELSGYDNDIDYYLNSIDPTIHGIKMDYGQGFIDNAYNFYEDAPEGYKVPTEHHDYIKNKVDELIGSKYSYLKPYYKRG
jgi:hypothetical protein